MKKAKSTPEQRRIALEQAFNYLRENAMVKNKQDMAQQLGKDPTTLSSAFSAKSGYLTDALFSAICTRYPGVFNIEHFVYGEGDLLAEHPSAPSSDILNDIVRNQASIMTMLTELGAKVSMLMNGQNYHPGAYPYGLAEASMPKKDKDIV